MSENDIKEQLKNYKGMVEFDEYGITGNTGLTGNTEGIIHYNANYSATENHVFIEIQEDGFLTWERIEKENIEDGMIIITCNYCDKPAISLDHSWPWLQENTTCEEHHEKLELIWHGIRKSRKEGICGLCKKDILKGQEIIGKGKGRIHLTC